MKEKGIQKRPTIQDAPITNKIKCDIPIYQVMPEFWLDIYICHTKLIHKTERNTHRHIPKYLGQKVPDKKLQVHSPSKYCNK